MYVIVEYVTCVAVTGGLIALVLEGWLLVLATREGVKRLAKRESTPEPQDIARPKESRAPIPTATLAATNPFTSMHLSDDHKTPGARCP